MKSRCFWVLPLAAFLVGCAPSAPRAPLLPAAAVDTLALPLDQRSPDVAHEAFMRAMNMRQQGNMDMAELFFLRALAHDPTSRFLVLETADILANNGKIPEAIAMVRRAMSMEGEPSAQEYFLLARLHRQNDALDSARVHYANSVALDDRNMRVLFEYAMLLEMVQDFAELSRIYRSLIPLMDLPQQLVEKQLLLLRLSNDNAGVADLLLQVWQSKNAHSYLFQWVDLMEEEGRLDVAIAELEKAREAEPSHVEILQKLARLLLRAGQPDAALGRLKDLHASDSLRHDVLQRIAMLEFDMGLLDSAYHHFRVLTTARPEDHLSYFYLSNLSSLRGDSSAAVTAAKRAISLRPDALAYRNQLAALYYLRHDYANAHTVLDAAIDKNPEHPLPLQFKGTALLHEAGYIESRHPIPSSPEIQRARGLRDEALGVLQRAHALDSASLDVIFDIAANLERLDSMNASIEWFERLLRLDPRHHQALNYLGYLLVDRQIDIQRGAALVDSALVLQPGNLAYLDSRAWALYRQDRVAQALAVLEMVEREGMDDPVVWEHMALICEKLGYKDRAKGYWQRVLHFNPNHALARERIQ